VRHEEGCAGRGGDGLCGATWGKFHKQNISQRKLDNMGITRIKHDSFGGRKNNGKIVG
jgi:hypothetical protein